MKKNDDKLNKVLYIYAWLIFAWMVFMLIMVLSSCAPLAETVYEDVYYTGGTFTENDTVIGTDTLYYWK